MRDLPFSRGAPTHAQVNSTMLTRADVERCYGPLLDAGPTVSTGAGVIEQWWTIDRRLIAVSYTLIHSPRRSPDDILQGDPIKCVIVKRGNRENTTHLSQ